MQGCTEQTQPREKSVSPPFWKRVLSVLWRSRWLRWGGGVPVALVLLLMLVSESYVFVQSHDRMVDSPSGLPSNSVGLVLGCSPMVGKHVNTSFVNRIKMASELWKSGKVSSLIVSGDNRFRYYNEPREMKKALVEQGVPEDKIVCDYAGLRTLDSIVRARDVFHAERVVIVSQPYHNARALAIAAHHGINAWACNAPDTSTRKTQLRMWLRERAARILMFLDLWVLGTSPHFGQ